MAKAETSRRAGMEARRAPGEGRVLGHRESERLLMWELREVQQGQAREECRESERLRMRQLRTAQQARLNTAADLLYNTSACHPTHSLWLAPTVFCIHLLMLMYVYC